MSLRDGVEAIGAQRVRLRSLDEEGEPDRALEEGRNGLHRGIAAKLDGPELRAVQQRQDAVGAYELVYAALGA